MQALAIPESLTIRCRPSAPDSNQSRQWRFEMGEEESLSERTIIVEYRSDDAPLSLVELAALVTSNGPVIRSVLIKRTPSGDWAGISKLTTMADSVGARRQASSASKGRAVFDPISDRDRQQALRLLAWLTKHRCGQNLPNG